MPPVVNIVVDFSAWDKLSDAVNDLANRLPHIRRAFLKNVADRYLTELQGRLISGNINWTETYMQSLQVQEGGTDQDPEVSIVLNPTGREAGRLGTYWNILEFGGRPNPNVPQGRIIQWVLDKGIGGPVDGIRIANSIRTRGIRPNPILQTIFQMVPPDNIIGVSSLGAMIAEQEAQLVMKDIATQFQRIVSVGRFGTRAQIPAGFPGAGKFIPMQKGI